MNRNASNIYQTTVRHCNLIDLRERFPATWKYQPLFDERGWVAEDVCAYINRMQNSYLPNWPDEPLKEWLHRHAGYDLETYSSLRPPDPEEFG